MKPIDIIILIIVLLIVFSVIGSYIYKRIKKKPTGECSMCNKRMKKAVEKALKELK